MLPITKQVLEKVAPKFHGKKHISQTKILNGIGPVITHTTDSYGISTLLRRAHFIAQICHESAGFCTLVEFASGRAYEGRADLGNTNAGDGVRYKGRGLIQLTGRNNYRKYGKLLGLDLEGEPELAATPVTALRIACEYWKQRHINHFCDNDDIIHVTRRVNGGLNGLAQRKIYLARAKQALSAEDVVPVAWTGPDISQMAVLA